MNVPRVHLEPELGDRRQLILAAAVQEFAEHGREGASTNRIARKAQVAKGLIFRYFTSKEGLFDAALDHACEHLFAPPRGALPADPFQRLEEFVVLRARAIEAHPVLARFIAQFRGRSRLVASKATRCVDRAYDNLRAIFKEGVQIEVFRRGWDFAAALELLSLVAEALEERFLVAVQQAGENEGEIASILDAKGVRERVRRFTEILKWGAYQPEAASRPQPLRAWKPEAFIALSAGLAPAAGEGDHRRERILRTAQALFAERGYEGASAEAIAAEARVAKGLIFHYFGSKADLYLAAVADSFTRISERFFDGLPQPEPDLFQRMYTWMQRKLEIFQAEPVHYQLVMSAFADPPPSVRASMEKYMSQGIELGWRLLLDGIDTEPIRPGVSPEDAIELVLMVAELVSERARGELAEHPQKGLHELERVFREAETFLEMLRDGLCPRG